MDKFNENSAIKMVESLNLSAVRSCSVQNAHYFYFFFLEKRETVEIYPRHSSRARGRERIKTNDYGEGDRKKYKIENILHYKVQ